MYLSYLSNEYRACSFLTSLDFFFCIDNLRVIYQKHIILYKAVMIVSEFWKAVHYSMINMSWNSQSMGIRVCQVQEENTGHGPHHWQPFNIVSTCSEVKAAMFLL
jgi:hypothetical protein